MEPSLQPSLGPSLKPSISFEPSSIPSTMLTWVDVSSVKQYEILPDTATNLLLFDNDTFNITLGFNYNWFGETITDVFLSSNGQININGRTTSYDDCTADAIGGYDGARIAFVQHHLYPPEGGAVKYLVKSSPASLKVSFEDVHVLGTNGFVQAQVELFANGDIIFCYGDGDMAFGDSFAAGVEDSRFPNAYPIPDAPFDSDGITYVWPGKKCWKFHMPAEWPSMAPSLSPSVSSIFEISLSNTIIILTSKGFHMHPNRCL